MFSIEKIAMTNFVIKNSANVFTEREMNLLEVLALSNAAFVNAQITQKGMGLNPQEKKAGQLFHYQFAFQESLDIPTYEQFEEI